MTLLKRILIFAVTLLSAIGVDVSSSEPPIWWKNALDFTGNQEIEPNLNGQLEGEVAFLQNTLVGPKRGDKKRPHLVAYRAAYMLFYPSKTSVGGYEVVLRDRVGEELTLSLSSPWAGARNDSNNKDGRPAVVYSKRAWSTVIPWHFMAPGLALEIRSSNGASGRFCLLYTSPSPRDRTRSRMPSSA